MDNLTNIAQGAAASATNLAQGAISSATNLAQGALSSIPGAANVDAVRNALKGLENGAVDPKALLASLKSKLPIPPNLPQIPKKPNTSFKISRKIFYILSIRFILNITICTFNKHRVIYFF